MMIRCTKNVCPPSAPASDPAVEAAPLPVAAVQPVVQAAPSPVVAAPVPVVVPSVNSVPKVVPSVNTVPVVVPTVNTVPVSVQPVVSSAPVAVQAAQPVVSAVPADVTNSQFHAQDDIGQYNYGYSSPTSTKQELKVKYKMNFQVSVMFNGFSAPDC